MPNWCYNELTLGIKDSAKDRGIEVLRAFTQDKPFQAIRPCPAELLDTMSGFHGVGTPEQAALERKYADNIAKYGYSNWYDWNNANWGTKWDVTPDQMDVLELVNGSWTVRVVFDSAWCPPDQLYHYISETYPDVELDAYWEEPGCGQKGTFYAYEGTFDSHIEDYVDEEEEVFELPESAATPNVGAATVLPLPGGNNK